MIGSLVITLREGIEAALVIGIILAYLRKTGRHGLNGYVYVGLGLAVAASLAVAAAFRAVDFDPENEVLEGALLGVAGFLVVTMVVWMWRTARGLRRSVEARLSALTGEGGAGRGAAAGLVLFTFFMVFREGVETVLFLQAVALGTEPDPLGLVGALLGLALAGLFAVLFVRGSLRVDLRRFFNVTSVVLLVLAAKLLVDSAHEFGEAGLIPLGEDVESLLGFLAGGEVATVVVMALVAVPIFLLLFESLRSPAPAAVAGGEGPAGRRGMLAAERLERVWQIGLAAAALAIVFALGSTAFAGGG